MIIYVHWFAAQAQIEIDVLTWLPCLDAHSEIIRESRGQCPLIQNAQNRN